MGVVTVVGTGCLTTGGRWAPGRVEVGRAEAVALGSSDVVGTPAASTAGSGAAVATGGAVAAGAAVAAGGFSTTGGADLTEASWPVSLPYARKPTTAAARTPATIQPVRRSGVRAR